ncbi:MAG: 6-phospho-beta-glucosidase [Acidobacteria bacterium]|nr:MAG: 6-phospho-beta-glucosidase [Acidobacteriota bacterium]
MRNNSIMKITLIGAAGVRTPLLVHGLAGAGENMRLEELAFWDIDRERLAVVGRVAEAMARRSGLSARLSFFSDLDRAVEGADYVITSIRVGGIDARVKDETIALAHGLVGQETVGAGGFACAMRNLAAMLEYARLTERVAPNATVINFTNPVGIISQGILNYSGIRILGVCDTPLETFESIAKALDRNPFELRFDYLGLNHLGWVRSIRDGDDAELLPKILSSPALIQKCYRHELFPIQFIQKLALLPTEYLYFYYFPKTAYENTRRNGKSRGEAVAAMNTKLFEKLARASEPELIGIYENYLRERNASYFSIEATAGEQRKENQELYSKFSGYERIALLVLQALHSERPSLIPLTVRNLKALEDLDSNDAVELPCQVSSSGVQVPPVGHAPEAVRPLLLQVKEYERLTVRASVERSREAALAALMKNPLVARPEVAREVLAQYINAFGAQMKLQAA